MGAVKAVTAAQLAMASDTVYRVSLDQAIEAMRLTAADMSVKYKETSLSVRPSNPDVDLRVLLDPPPPIEFNTLTKDSVRSLLGSGGASSCSVCLPKIVLIYFLEFADNSQDTTYRTHLVRSFSVVTSPPKKISRADETTSLVNELP